MPLELYWRIVLLVTLNVALPSPKLVISMPSPSAEPELGVAATPIWLLVIVADRLLVPAALSRLLMIVSALVSESRIVLLVTSIVAAPLAPATRATPPPPVLMLGSLLVSVLPVKSRSPPPVPSPMYWNRSPLAVVMALFLKSTLMSAVPMPSNWTASSPPVASMVPLSTLSKVPFIVPVVLSTMRLVK